MARCFLPVIFAGALLHFAVGARAAAGENAGAPRWETRQPGNVFLNSIAPRFYPAPGARFAGSWQVRDYHGQSVAIRYNVELSPDEAAVTLPFLPCGYYTLELAEGPPSQRRDVVPFTVVAPPAAAKSPGDDASPFALDTALSALLRGGTKPVAAHGLSPEETAARLIELAGVRQIRERLSWSEVNPAPEEFDWQRYEENAALLARHGLSVLDVFHDAPPWSREALTSLPRDLLGLSRFTEAAGRRLGGAVSAWEFWNEPDTVAYCADSAWDFASAQKAAFLGWQRAPPGTKILLGSSAIHPGSRFFDVVLENLGGGYFDVCNLHAYDSHERYAAMIEDTRRTLARSGSGGKPIWVTEAGLRNEGPGRQAAAAEENTREHDQDQEREQAAFLVKSLVTLASLGAERSYFFVLPPYNENSGGKVWGLLRWDWTAKPAYAALATLLRQTANCRYAGKVNLGEGVSAFLFSPLAGADREAKAGSQTLVVWAGSPVKVAIPGLQSQSRMVDIVGAEQSLSTRQSRGGIEANSEPLYFSHLSGLAASEPAQPAEPAAPKHVSPVTLSLQLASRGTIHNRVAVDVPDASRWSLTVWNLSGEQRQIQLRDLSQGFSVEGLPRQLQLAPMSCKRVPLEASRAAQTAEAARLSIGGSSSPAETLTPVVVPVLPSVKARAQSAAHTLETANRNKWQILVPAGTKASAAATRDEITFSAAFPRGVVDRWFYPEYALPSQALAGTGGISFEIRATNHADAIEKAHVIFPGAAADSPKILFPITVTDDWQRVTLWWDCDAPAGFDPAQMSAVQIGCNLRSESFSFAVRDLQIIGHAGPALPDRK